MCNIHRTEQNRTETACSDACVCVWLSEVCNFACFRHKTCISVGAVCVLLDVCLKVKEMEWETEDPVGLLGCQDYR